jgi:hypothetical protein
MQKVKQKAIFPMLGGPVRAEDVKLIYVPRVYLLPAKSMTAAPR